MIIAFDCRFSGLGGIGTYIDNLVDNIMDCKKDWDYLLVCNKKRSIQNAKNVRYIETEIKPFSIKEFFSFPVEEINKCDVFFTPYINIPSGIKIPVYCVIHDMLFFDVSGLTSSMGKIIRKFYYSRAIRLSKKIFTVSEFSKGRILQHIKTDKDIEVAYNGVSKNICEYDLDNNIEKENYFIYVGNIKKHKGLHTLVEAYKLYKDSGGKTRLIIVGNNENFRTADTELYMIINHIPEIEFTGYVTDEKLTQMIAKAEALIQPSLYEGFGIPPLEALCLGTNVLLSDIPVFKEIYADYPVTFFKVKDPIDLSNKMSNFKTEIITKNTKILLMQRYSYKNLAQSVINTFTN